ncbi:Aste57867_24450 [Aphanomyces stellatus]|uniref:Aste57867_24450 protein n=1 Tax=Aphanomyces stellatus TaxID=120398 RepID=A0A485LQI6_9STRA|nr:hypothetical protein As57867_024374 [Aphanomyces stellatus]VFU01090.1 Aste57867_24450 [Aphanomyces stellatus]
MGDRKPTGRRQRKNAGGLTNLKRDRWKFLSCVDEIPISKVPLGRVDEAKKKKAEVVAVDIDGDGLIDVREMRMAKYLHDITSKMTKPDGSAPTDAELHEMRVTVGRYTLAQEFIERNKGKLWRYGPMFADKSNEESVRFIADHKNFKKILPYLEFVERRRTIRSSGNIRGVMANESTEDDDGVEQSENNPQTWIYTQRKLKTPTRMKMLAVHKAVNSTYVSRLEEKDDDPALALALDQLDEPEEVTKPPTAPRKHSLESLAPTPPKHVFQNEFGVIDIDGDGVVDDWEMQLHTQLMESAAHQIEAVDLNGDGRIDENERLHAEKTKQSTLQAEGRRLMAKDFVSRNTGDMWLYNPVYRGKTDDEVITLLANDKGVFSKTMNHLRAKERVLVLKSSKGVTGCLVDPKELKYRVDPANVLTPRQVKSKAELDMAQREFSKGLASHGVEGKSVFVKNLRLDALQQFDESKIKILGRSQSTPVIGLPKLYQSPVKLASIREFRITKWKTGDAQK